MKIALVHDYLNQVGGGERVLDELMRMFPEAPVYTLLYDEKKTLGRYAGRVKKTSFLDFSLARRFHRLFIPFMPLAARSLNLGGEYDLIISDSAGFAKGIRYDKTKTKHLCYVHTPLRYAWETDQYFSLSVVGRLFSLIFKPAFAYVRRFDYWAAQQPDVLIVNSQYIASKIKEYYDRDAEVVYPPVDSSRFNPPLQKEVSRSDGGFSDSKIPPGSAVLPFEKGDYYYLAAGRLLHYKRFDLIIDAFARLGLPLKIAGTGPEFRRLSLRASRQVGAAIQFLGYVPEEQLRELYAGATAFIMANEEDFGLVMAEAQACGTPVIAYGRGGALEIVEPRVTGMLFSLQTVESLVETVQAFERLRFDRTVICKKAKRFSIEHFREGVQAAIRVLTASDLQKM